MGFEFWYIHFVLAKRATRRYNKLQGQIFAFAWSWPEVRAADAAAEAYTENVIHL